MAGTIEMGAREGRLPTERRLPARRTPIYRGVDVLVCGGGPAGVAAAITAARAGADTLLVERNVVLGGNGPLSFTMQLAESDRNIAGEVVARLRGADAIGPDRLGDGATLAHDPEALKYALLDLTREAGVKLLLCTYASDPIAADGRVAGAIVENKSGRFAIPARQVIDATGDADLALRAGVRFVAPAEAETMTLNARIGGIDFDRALAARAEWPDRVAEAKRRGALSPGQPDTIQIYGVTEAARHRGIAFLRGPRLPGSAADADDLTIAETVARGLMREFLPFLRTVPGFEASFLVDVAGAVAITPSRHLAGPAPSGAAQPGIDPAWFRPRKVAGLIVTGRAAAVAAHTGEHDGFALGEAAGAAAAEALREQAAA